MNKVATLKGIVASAGNAQAKVFLIKDVLNVPDLPVHDYIIVAPYTTPLLNLVVSTAKGIVCETGGITTHAAIIARELGIPCIVSAVGILEQAKPDQDIEINSQTGEVTLYE